MQNLDTNKAKDSAWNDDAANSVHAASHYPNEAKDAGKPHKKIIKKIVCRQTEHLTTSFSSRSIVVI